MIPHSAVGHLAESSNVGIGCIRQARRPGLGGVVTEEEDGMPLRFLDGDATLCHIESEIVG